MMIRPSDREWAVAIATVVLAADVVAAGGIRKLSVENIGDSVNRSVGMAAAILAGVMRQMPPTERRAEGPGPRKRAAG